MNQLASLITDLYDEQTALDDIVTVFDNDDWNRPTPAEGWTSRHQIAHLAFFDATALMSLTDPEAFAQQRRRADRDPDAYSIAVLEPLLALTSAQLLDTWRQGRRSLLNAFRSTPAGTRHPWYGPSMSVASMVTARLMETWAHGQDVADALGVVRRPTARLRHVAWIGLRARDYAYLVRGITPPAEPFRVELTGPDSEHWAYGPEDAAQRITGPALDFCLLVTQRVHRADTALVAHGPDAEQWLDIAQAFAGPAGPGRPPKEA